MATRALDLLHNLVWIMLCCESERCRLICDESGLADILPLWGLRGINWSSLDGACGVKSRYRSAP